VKSVRETVNLVSDCVLAYRPPSKTAKLRKFQRRARYRAGKRRQNAGDKQL
jgi:hypothetical protein